MVSLARLREESPAQLLEHIRAVAAVIPASFLLQPAVGGRILPYEFWQVSPRSAGGGDQIAPFKPPSALDVVRPSPNQAAREISL